MSAFQAYGGDYQFGGERYRWRCYATARVYDLRKPEHRPLPPPPAGLRWTPTADPRCADRDLAWLVEEDGPELVQILVQVEPAAA